MADSQKFRKARSYAAQIIACSLKNSLLYTVGITYAFFTIVIEAPTAENENRIPLNTRDEKSWFASIFFLFPIVGSVISGPLTDVFGRKILLIFSNLPHLASWILFYFVKSVNLMYFGSALLGFGIGLMEAPVLTYMGEIAEVRLRGTLIALTSISVQMGLWTSFGLNVFLNWRTISLLSILVIIFSMVSILFLPETPQWLLTKEKPEKALKSLQWLRGWAPKSVVQYEFARMIRYKDYMKKCDACIAANIPCIHLPLKFKEKIKELFGEKCVKPMALIIGLFAISQFSGYLCMRPYIGPIFNTLNVPIKEEMGKQYLGMIGVVAAIVSFCTIYLTGKRIACIISYTGALLAISMLIIHSYFRPKDKPSYIPLIGIYVLCFCNLLGSSTIPWFLVSEITPLKIRGLCSGLAAGSNYLFAFCAVRSFPELEHALSLVGTMYFFLAVNILGFLVIVFLLPETEKVSLEEIEHHFTRKGLWKTKIEKIVEK